MAKQRISANQVYVGVTSSNGQVLTSNGTVAYWANSSGGFSNGQSILVNTFVANAIASFTANVNANGIVFFNANTVANGISTFNSNVVISNTATLIANGSSGSAGQILSVNSTSGLYWTSTGFSNGQSILVNTFVANAVATFSANVNVNGLVFFNANTTANGISTFNGNSTINGVSTFNGNTIIGGTTLSINANTTANGISTFNGNVVTNGTVILNANTTANGTTTTFNSNTLVYGTYHTLYANTTANGIVIINANTTANGTTTTINSNTWIYGTTLAINANTTANGIFTHNANIIISNTGSIILGISNQGLANSFVSNSQVTSAFGTHQALNILSNIPSSTFSTTLSTSSNNVSWNKINISSNAGAGFTVEFFFYFTALGSSQQSIVTTGPADIGVSANTTSVVISDSGYSSVTASGFNIQNNVWNHFAYMGYNGSTYCAINGQVVNLNSAAGHYGSGTWGGWGNLNGPGKFSNFRIVGNNAIYNLTGFNPPLAPLAPIPGTQFLTLTGNTTLFDMGPNKLAISNSAGVSPLADTITLPSTVYSTSVTIANTYINAPYVFTSSIYANNALGNNQILISNSTGGSFWSNAFFANMTFNSVAFHNANIAFGLNNLSLNFKTLNGNTVNFIQQNDDNFVFYTTNTTGGQRAVFSIYANSITSNLNFSTPVLHSSQTYISDANNLIVGTPTKAAASGSTVLPNGIIMNWGSVSASSTGAAVTFARPFSTFYNIQCTPILAHYTYQAGATATSTTGATITTSNTTATTIYYQALGV